MGWAFAPVRILVMRCSDVRITFLPFMMTGMKYHPPYIQSNSRSLTAFHTPYISSGERPIKLGYDHMTLIPPLMTGMMESAVKITEGRFSLDRSQWRIAEPIVRTEGLFWGEHPESGLLL